MSTVRIFQWVQALIIALKLTTGLYLHNQDFLNLPVIWVKVHFYLTHLLLINFILFGYYYLLTGYHHFLMMKIQVLKQVPGYIKQRLMMTIEHPFNGTYNPWQKLIYSLWVLLFMVELVTGFSLYFEASSQWLLSLAGGVQKVRLYHFLGTIGLLAAVPLHQKELVNRLVQSLQRVYRLVG